MDTSEGYRIKVATKITKLIPIENIIGAGSLISASIGAAMVVKRAQVVLNEIPIATSLDGKSSEARK